MILPCLSKVVQVLCIDDSSEFVQILFSFYLFLNKLIALVEQSLSLNKLIALVEQSSF